MTCSHGPNAGAIDESQAVQGHAMLTMRRAACLVLGWYGGNCPKMGSGGRTYSVWCLVFGV